MARDPAFPFTVLTETSLSTEKMEVRGVMLLGHKCEPWRTLEEQKCGETPHSALTNISLWGSLLMRPHLPMKPGDWVCWLMSPCEYTKPSSAQC